MELHRCRWVDPTSELYTAYHDCEWGTPEHDDRKLFEMLILEGFQVLVLRRSATERIRNVFLALPFWTNKLI